MLLCEDQISAFRKLLTDPIAYDLPIRPLADCLRESEKVVANHILFQSLDKEYKRAVPKIIMYIVLDQIYGPCREKDENGDLGRRLEFRPATEPVIA